MVSAEVDRHPVVPKRPRRNDWLLAAALVAVVFLVYQPVWRGGFLWDDDAHVTRLELRSWQGLYRIWFDAGATQQYYPLLHSAFWIEHKLWGDTTLGYHLVNIAMHALAAVLVALILRRLAVPGAYLAAAIFALHPVQVESVAWITELKNTLSAAFYLGAALVYLRFDKTRNRPLYVAALALFVLGLLSKTVTATLPAALLVVFWWQRGRLSWRRDVLPLVPFFVIGMAAGLFTASFEQEMITAGGAAFEIAPLERCLLAGRVIWFYLAKLFWPVDLLFIYPRWTVSQSVWWQYLFPAATALLLVALWALRRRWRGPLAGVLFFVGTLFPVLGFCNVYPFIYSFVADHFQYLASLGIITLTAAGIALLLARRGLWNRPVGNVLCVALLAVLATLTWHQCRMYADVETLYNVTIAGNPNCWMAHNNLGMTLAGRGRYDEAIAHYEEALTIRPDCELPHNNLGVALADCGRLDEAIAHYQAALKIKPNYAEAHNNLGNALAKRGQVGDAIDHYQTALRIKPDYASAYNNLGVALLKRGRLDDAIEHYQTALKFKPDYAEAHNNLGRALANRGQLDDAIEHFQAALKIKPDYAEAHNNLGSALAMHGRVEEAIEQFQDAVEFRPDYADAYANLAAAQYRQGDVLDAVKHWHDTLRLRPNRVIAMNQLAWALATCPEPSVRNGVEAIDLAQRAVDLSGGQEPAILDTLAAAYAETGRFSMAVQTAQGDRSRHPAE